MAKYSAVKATVNAYIKQNGRKEITGRILNAVLNATIDSLGKYFQFAGGALPTDDPGTPDQNVCYLAGEPGVYTNFGGITIENEEVALLFWDGEWTKQRILIGIREVNASVDNQVGTPSVDVSYSGGELVLTFHNLKGDQGETGDPAGFGTIGADINGGVGTPGVSVETSGDNTAKNLMFHFTNLKGETGVTSVVATIDDTSGAPSCQVSLVGQQLTLAFSGLKGLKGDTGVSADYPITIYNGLDSDATDQALAAAQGKVLDGKVSQLRQEVTEKIGGSITPELAIEQGNISNTGEDSTANNRIRTSNFVTANAIRITTSGNKVYLRGYKNDGTYVSGLGWLTTTQTISIDGADKYRFIFAFSNDNTIAPEDFVSLGISIEAEFDGTFAPNDELTRLSEDVSILEKKDKFVGEGQTFASSSELKLLAGKKYRIFLKNPNWDKSSIAGGSTVLLIRSSYNGVFTTLVQRSIAQTIDSYYDITVPSTSDFITIGGRASVGTIVDFYIFQLELVDERVIAGIEQNELVHTVTTNRGLEIDNTAHTIKVLSDLNVRVNGVVYTLPENTTYDLASFTTQTEYVKLIVNTDNLSLDLLPHNATTKYPVIAVFQKQYSSNIILGVIGSPIIGKIIIDGVPALVAPVWNDVTFLKSHSLVNQFVGANNTEAYTDIYGLMPSHKYRIYFPVTEWDMSGVSVTGVYKMFVNSVKNGATTRLVNVSMSGTVQQYYDIETPSDFDFLRIGGRATSGVAVGFTITDNTTDEESPFDIPQKANDFALLFNGTAGAVESFIFVTDPHWYNRYAIAGINPIYEDNFETLKNIWDKTPTDFVLSGGDWLNAHKQSIAVEDLADIDALMNKTFGAYYPILGNHDNNYQGELDNTEDTSANDGALSNQTMVNLWFRKWGRLYYSFKGMSSRFIIFDSGIDWDTAMNSYRWGQIAWFANELNNNTDEHIIIGLHIVCNSGSVFTEHIASLADNILQVAEAFNARTTITMNGVTYDFTNAQGKIHCALCGHTHYDATAVIHNIPVFCTTTALDGAFDLVLVDYGAGKLKSIRVGSGSNREINLVQ